MRKINVILVVVVRWSVEKRKGRAVAARIDRCIFFVD